MKTYKKFTTDQYHHMIEAGILTKDDRVQLLDGEIIEISPIGKKHAACVNWLSNFFARSLEESQAIIRTQGPVTLSDSSEPEPDVVLLKPRDDFYRSSLPTPADVFLLIEVGESSASFDREVKLPLYLKGEIPEVWLVDLGIREISLFRTPHQDGYRESRKVRGDESISPMAFPQISLSPQQVMGE